jgi:hypothetical protein
MKFVQHLQKFRAPLAGAALGLAAFLLPSQSAQAVAVQGCGKINGVLTPGVKVDVFDATRCTLITSGYTFGAGGDFVIQDATGFANNRSIYLMLTTPDGCIEIVDNATVCNAVITDPSDPRLGWAALCTDILGNPVQCTTGVTRVVLQYLGTSTQTVTAWGTTTKSKAASGSKAGKVSSKDKAPKPSSKDKKASSKTTKPSSKTTKPGSKTPAAPLFISNVQPCNTFSFTLPSTPVGKGSKIGSKSVWKLGSKANRSQKFLVNGGSKVKRGSKVTNVRSIGTVTLFVGNNVNTRIDVSCASGIAVGQVYGMFRVIRLEDNCGNRICPPQRPPNCTTKVSPNLITFK